jgi:hypothetical protein
METHVYIGVTALQRGIEFYTPGAVLLRPIQEREWGRMANLTDPFDNHFDLIELAPGGYDRMAQAPGSQA